MSGPWIGHACRRVRKPGAVAPGHPIGASDAAPRDDQARRQKGLTTLCIGGGIGIAVCVARD
jgi:acetyl-CoA C-acetyltransferase